MDWGRGGEFCLLRGDDLARLFAKGRLVGGQAGVQRGIDFAAGLFAAPAAPEYREDEHPDEESDRHWSHAVPHVGHHTRTHGAYTNRAGAMRAEMRADLPRTPSGHPTVFETDVRPNLPTPWLKARLSLPRDRYR